MQTKLCRLRNTIIALQDGKIIEKGSPAMLFQSNGYVSKLGISLPSSEDIVEETAHELSPEPAYKSADMAKETDKTLTDIRRKNADMSVYKYYLANAGYTAVCLYVISVIVWVFCSEFSSKSTVLNHQKHLYINKNASRWGQMVVRSQY